MRGFQPKISMECANKPASGGLKRSWGWKQDSTKRNLAKPHQPKQQGFVSAQAPHRKAGASGKRPFHLLTGTSSAVPVRSVVICLGQESGPIPSPARLPDQWLKSGHSRRTLEKVAIFLPMLLSRELLFLTLIG